MGLNWKRVSFFVVKFVFWLAGLASVSVSLVQINRLRHFGHELIEDSCFSDETSGIFLQLDLDTDPSFYGALIAFYVLHLLADPNFVLLVIGRKRLYQKSEQNIDSARQVEVADLEHNGPDGAKGKPVASYGVMSADGLMSPPQEQNNDPNQAPSADRELPVATLKPRPGGREQDYLERPQLAGKQEKGADDVLSVNNEDKQVMQQIRIDEEDEGELEDPRSQSNLP